MEAKKSSDFTRFIDRTEKYIYPNGEEFTFFPDGTVQLINKDGIKLIEYVDGSRDAVFPNDQRIRVEANGDVKTI